MPPHNPVQFLRKMADGILQLAGNRVQLEDSSGTAYDLANPIPAEIGPSTTIVHGQNTVANAGTEEALVAVATPLASGVRVKALHANTGWVYVGANPVTSATGYVLDAGEEVFIEIDDASKIYIDVSVNNEGVSFIGS